MHLELLEIDKRFAGVQALSGVSLHVERGSVHGLVGENGAGKSTLGKIVAGVIQPDSGTIRVAGSDPIRFRSPREALAHGITMIAQEQALEEKRTVAENVLLGMEPRRRWFISRKALNRRFSHIAQTAGFPELARSADQILGSMRVSERQKVEVVRALARDAELVVMDEPTAALAADHVEKLLETVRSLRDAGITIIYISHHLSEVLEVADTVTVLRDGRLIRTGPSAEESPESLVGAMLGRPADLAFPEKSPPPLDAPLVLSVQGLMRPPLVNDVSFEVRAGEIVGLAGLMGSGRTELVRAVFGADRPDSGAVELKGRPVSHRSPRHAIRSGIAMLPESRKDQGLFLLRSVKENITVPYLQQFARMGVLAGGREQVAAESVVRDLDVKTPSLRTRVSALSGGNQQRVLFARWLMKTPSLLMVDEPTRGVDVGAKRAIYELIVSLAAQGMGVLLVSSELEEVLGLSHRVLVISDGSITAEFEGTEITESTVLSAVFMTEDNSSASGS